MLRARLHASTRNLNISDVEDGKQQQNRAGSTAGVKGSTSGDAPHHVSDMAARFTAGAIAGTGAGDQKQGSEQRKPPLPLSSHPPLDQFKARARLLPPAPIMEPISPASALSGGSPVHSPGAAPSPRPALPPRPSGAASPPVGPRKTVAAASGSTAGGERDDAMRQKQAADFTRYCLYCLNDVRCKLARPLIMLLPRMRHVCLQRAVQEPPAERLAGPAA